MNWIFWMLIALLVIVAIAFAVHHAVRAWCAAGELRCAQAATRSLIGTRWVNVAIGVAMAVAVGYSVARR